ncbi:hypothetical protein PHYBOEH_010448 [Phytophthora boehmeriae]|uniref:Uncharacterized protein n=1 Tax=Phytophthora boehmeriae TaxID=109152 RepID=A0A8T1WZE1_9STRA|nr:hypothetical protein PHYBOEH_010448 [Phytophthora boehmeriae]
MVTPDTGTGTTNAGVLRDWAASTTDAWSKEVQKEWKRQQRCESYVRIRVRKKQTLIHMRREQERLQCEVRRRLTALANMKSFDGVSSNKNRAIGEVYRLALESESLRNENLAIHERLQLHERFLSLTYEAIEDCADSPKEHLSIADVSRNSKWVAHQQKNEAGWMVQFPTGEPSFYFHPLKREEYDASIDCCAKWLSENPPHIEPVAELFGWTIHYSPLTRRSDNNSLVAHARFTTRIKWSLDDMNEMLEKSDINTFPLLSTPLNWSYKRRDEVSTQVLQKMEDGVYVLVYNIPGVKHFRYIQLARRLYQTRQDGRRSTAYVMVIADPNQAGAQTQLDVEWATEGGSYMEITEVDDSTIDVSYDHWAGCQDELHAQHLFIRWTQFTVQLPQSHLPPRLLTV